MQNDKSEFSEQIGEKSYSKFDRWILKHFEGMAKR